jgi:hypothetical protein
VLPPLLTTYYAIRCCFLINNYFCSNKTDGSQTKKTGEVYLSDRCVAPVCLVQDALENYVTKHFQEAWYKFSHYGTLRLAFEIGRITLKAFVRMPSRRHAAGLHS